MVVRASVAAMVIAMLLVILCVSCVFLCGVQLLHLGDSPYCYCPPRGHAGDGPHTDHFFHFDFEQQLGIDLRLHCHFRCPLYHLLDRTRRSLHTH